MSTYKYFFLLPWELKLKIDLIKKSKFEDRAIFKTREDIILPILETYGSSHEAVLMIENYYMN